MTGTQLVAAVAAGYLIGFIAREVGVLAAWLDERRTDRLAR